jgi:hypothetical protein
MLLLADDGGVSLDFHLNSDRALFPDTGAQEFHLSKFRNFLSVCIHIYRKIQTIC